MRTRFDDYPSRTGNFRMAYDADRDLDRGDAGMAIEGIQMTRREFIALIGIATAAGTRLAFAQTSSRMALIW
jgi:hypothetical protein